MSPPVSSSAEPTLGAPADQARVLVVIPVYRVEPTPLERMSLRRAAQVLHARPRCLVCPEDLDESRYRELLGSIDVHRFPPAFFRSVRDYSRLLRLPDFYARFLAHEYILIYQADCYVFDDRLDAFCGRDHDYVGAPWWNFDWLAKRRPWARPLTKLPWLWNRVGNGGLSLRRTRTLYEATRRFRALGERLDVQEDLYVCNLLARLDPQLRTARFDEALRFAFESFPRRGYQALGRQLPFGCHAFQRFDFDFWREHFDPDELRLAGVEPLPRSER